MKHIELLALRPGRCLTMLILSCLSDCACPCSHCFSILWLLWSKALKSVPCELYCSLCPGQYESPLNNIRMGIFAIAWLACWDSCWCLLNEHLRSPLLILSIFQITTDNACSYLPVFHLLPSYLLVYFAFALHWRTLWIKQRWVCEAVSAGWLHVDKPSLQQV